MPVAAEVEVAVEVAVASPGPFIRAIAGGDIEAMALYAGHSVDAVRQIQPAADIVRELCEGAERVLRTGASS